MNQAILLPVLAMLLLVFVVWIYMFVTRFTAIAREKIDTRAMNTPEALARVLPAYAAYPAHNFRNLFEVPVLFYVLCLYLYVIGQGDTMAVDLAWTFVGLRALHSVVQCTYNDVVHRFTLYFFSCVALWAMLFRAIAAAV